jgi:Pol polyprotein
VQKSLISPEVEIYDSGASDHIFPFQHRFISFQSIPPCPIITANQGTFNAISKGDVKINIPNGNNSAPIILKISSIYQKSVLPSFQSAIFLRTKRVFCSKMIIALSKRKEVKSLVKYQKLPAGCTKLSTLVY